MLITGCDPGFNGAIALVEVDGEKCEVKCVDDLPTKYAIDEAGKKRRMYDMDLLLKLLKKYSVCQRMFLESNLIMDTNSKFSVASTAFGAGLILGMSKAIGIDVKFAAPRRWQAWVNRNAAVHLEREKLKVNGKKPDSKQMAELFIKDRLPRKAQLIYGPRGGLLDGRSDAICIAMYGAHIVCQQK